MATIKRFLAYMLGGAILGAVIASLIGLWVIPWYNSPGEGAPMVFNLAPFAKHVTESVLQGQLVGAGIGAVLLLVLGIVIHRSRAKKAEALAAASTVDAQVKAPEKVPPAPM